MLHTIGPDYGYIRKHIPKNNLGLTENISDIFASPTTWVYSCALTHRNNYRKYCGNLLVEVELKARRWAFRR